METLGKEIPALLRRFQALREIGGPRYVLVESPDSFALRTLGCRA